MGTGIATTLADMQLQPDYSWTDDTISKLCGGILAVCLIVAVGALAVGALRWTAAHVTRTLVDDPHGDGVIIACLIGSLLLGSISASVQYGIDKFGTVSVATSTEESSANPTAITQSTDGESELLNTIDGFISKIDGIYNGFANLKQQGEQLYQQSGVGEIGTGSDNDPYSKENLEANNKPSSSDGDTTTSTCVGRWCGHDSGNAPLNKQNSGGGSSGGSGKTPYQAAQEEAHRSVQDSLDSAGRCWGNYGLGAPACLIWDGGAATGKELGRFGLWLGNGINEHTGNFIPRGIDSLAGWVRSWS